MLGMADADVEYIAVEGMNHLMKMTFGEPEALLRSYYDPTMPVSDECTETMHDFIAAQWE
jgi:hypothetical protein